MKDLRIAKTEKIIKEAFISLVEQKGYAKVSIKDIAEKAMINRNTFYLHYYDKIDLVDKLVSEIFLEQKEKISTLKMESFDEPAIKSVLHGLLSVFYEEIEFYRILLLDSNLSGYLDKLEKELEKSMVNYLKLDYQKKHLAIDYVFFGMIGIIKRWIIMDNAKIDEIVDLLCTIALNDLKKYIVI